MKYYHGTDYDSGISIIKTGFNPDHTVWNCSSDRVTYLVDELYDNGPYGEDLNDIPAIRFALMAGQIAAAHNEQQSDKIIIFELDIPDDVFVEYDKSCSNMYHCHQINNDILNENIRNKNITMTIHVLHRAYVPCLRIFYLCNLDDNLYIHNNESELDVINVLQKTNTCWFYDEYMGLFDTSDIITIDIEYPDSYFTKKVV